MYFSLSDLWRHLLWWFLRHALTFQTPTTVHKPTKADEWGMTSVTFITVGQERGRSSSLSLSRCSYGNRVEHFRVLEGDGQYCIWEETFCSLNRLVDFYRTHSIAVDKVVCLRDPPLLPQLHVQSGCNPYPNPYKNCSQESLHTAHLHSHHERESGRQLDPGVRQTSIMLMIGLI